jgi:hypothetical protein
MIMSIAPFVSDKELISFAGSFFGDRVGSFRKDVTICLTGNAKRSHAYFPALITCIGFLDLLSGLYAGRLEGHGLSDLKLYCARFMNAAHYDPLRLEILYLAFRHKLAHLSFPYLVFDTSTKREYSGHKQRRITWTVQATRRKPPIELIDYNSPQIMKKSLRPWPVSYDCRVVISVRSFQTDIVKSIYGSAGLLSYIKSDATARSRFAKCMKVFYPP